MIAELQRRLHTVSGLDLDAASVHKAASERMRALALPDLAVYTALALREADEFQTLLDAVVVPETWFFREPETFSAAAAIARGKREHGSAPLRMLSVPCASGEEPYSLAMALLDAGLQPTDFTLHGVDISAHALALAQAGSYTRNSFRGTDPWIRHRYFRQLDGRHILAPEIRQLVRFSRASLFELNPERWGHWDMIFCRNLLIYFDDSTQRRAVAALDRLLLPDGVLFVGYAEAPSFCRHGFAPSHHRRAFALMRQAAPPKPTPGLPPRPLQLTRSVPARTLAAVVPERKPPAKPEQMTQASEAVALLRARAAAAANAGRFEDAARLYRRCLRLAPDDAELHFMFGLVNERLDDMAAAERYLRRAIYLDPDHYEALCHLALLKDQEGEAGRADGLRQRAARVYARLYKDA